MILNRQDKTKVDVIDAEALVRRLSAILGLKNKQFNVCFVNDEQMCALNAAYRGKSKPTDVLSFPWKSHSASESRTREDRRDPSGEFEGFLGEVVISAETARRNAESESHELGTEISWLILHGLLHLIGMDHETDGGEMAALEHDLRARLGLGGNDQRRSRSQKAERKAQRRRGLSRETQEQSKDFETAGLRPRPPRPAPPKIRC